MSRRLNTKARFNTNNRWADIQTGTSDFRDKLMVDANQLIDEMNPNIVGYGWQAQSLTRIMHSFHILIRAKNSRTTINSRVGLHSFKDLLAIMEDSRGGMHIKRTKRDDTRIIPPRLLRPVH
mmetsp:Transcript_22057/g.62006  ORF Transcript_22057/g.62006 Transcript_22057/m.62006 type:complete len:122 (-) Transcript_22057:73-438(-)